jgi:SAM-dependent methyltransferase
MPFTLDEIVPWGRSSKEYVRMFPLTDADLDTRILGCGDGPASFNAAMNQQGKRVVSVDPLYAFSAEQIRSRVQDAYRTIMEQLVANQSEYAWTTIRSPEELGQIRMKSMEAFLQDFEQGKSDGRYLPVELPELPFSDGEFDLALCSHLLFTYSGQLSQDFHCRAVLEMQRVAEEIRIFPLIDHEGQPSPHVETVCRLIEERGGRWVIESVNYRFQRRGNQMLRAWG